jgi:hypothetical protein
MLTILNKFLVISDFKSTEIFLFRSISINEKLQNVTLNRVTLVSRSLIQSIILCDTFNIIGLFRTHSTKQFSGQKSNNVCLHWFFRLIDISFIYKLVSVNFYHRLHCRNEEKFKTHPKSCLHFKRINGVFILCFALTKRQ